MTILSTQTISGSASAQSIEYPEIAARNAKIALIFDGYAEDITLYQSEDGPNVRVPSGESQPFPAGPFRVGNPPSSVLVAVGDSVTITIQRIPA